MDNFDLWNIQKKRITERDDTKFCKVREIWWCSIGFNIGHEENGKGLKFTRPILVLKKYGPNNILVVPITTSSGNTKFKLNLGSVTGKNSFVIISQLRVIDIKRLQEKIVTLPKEDFKVIRKAIRKNI